MDFFSGWLSGFWDRLSGGYLARIASARTSPLLESAASARAYYPSRAEEITDDVYTLSRVLGSEHFSGRPVELCCLADAGANKAQAAGQSLHQYATGGAGYGSQGGARQVSTARMGGPRHVLAALAVVGPGGPARGISQGARRYFDPKAQLALLAQYGIAHYCPPDVILKRWTYDLSWGSERCSLKTARGSHQEEWVGPIDGVDPYQLMLMRPKTAQQDALYAEALKIIESKGSYKGSAPLPVAELALIAAAVAVGRVLV